MARRFEALLRSRRRAGLAAEPSRYLAPHDRDTDKEHAVTVAVRVCGGWRRLYWANGAPFPLLTFARAFDAAVATPPPATWSEVDRDVEEHFAGRGEE